MIMGKPTGFLEYERMDGTAVTPKERVKDFCEFHEPLTWEEQRTQAARCMECGVPFCQAGMKVGSMNAGCTLHNLIPEMNDLVYHGKWEEAYERLSKTNCFPEFTGRVCPALCEAACTCGLNGRAVASKANERAIIEYAFEHGLVKPDVPKVRTGKRIAVVGSGPSGLSVAFWLNHRGHHVTVYERSDKTGGLLRYGIPNMKLDKGIIDRRVEVMKQSGIEFICNVDVGKDITGEELKKQYDRVVLACGASNPRNIQVKGRDALGIYFAVDFLGQVTKELWENQKTNQKEKNRKEKNLSSHQEKVQSNICLKSKALVEGKKVVVIGGGDTGNDCVATAIRLGAKSVVQLEMMPKLPQVRSADNPWPEWPKVLKTDYGLEEAIAIFGQDPRRYETTVTEFIKDEQGNVSGAKIVKMESKYDAEAGRYVMQQVAGTEEEIKAELVLIAAGFLGCEPYICESMGVIQDNRTNVKTKADSHETLQNHVYVVGDMRNGQSLVVTAIADGKEAARQIDMSLMGYSNIA